MSATVTPFLMFQGRAEEAMQRYLSLFPDGRIVKLVRRPATGAQTVGSILLAKFTIGGQTILCSDSDVQHAFTFTPSSSLFVDFESESELVRVLDALSVGGVLLMELDNYGFSRKFAWLNDEFGVSWQLNLP
jgi:predicted 3-demethylubiquinone-9 3-methyltransferase (glyoxalase superfamily)